MVTPCVWRRVGEGGGRERGREKGREKGREGGRKGGTDAWGQDKEEVTMGTMAFKHFVCVKPNMRTQVTHAYVQLHKCTLAFCVLASP